MAVITSTNYKNWKPVLHTVIKDQSLAKTIHEKGFAVIPFLNDRQLTELKELYKKEHNIKAENGAMFYTLYSKDRDYRQRIHTQIAEIVSPQLEAYFTDYKNIVNIFINKISGTESGFYTHQDTTALNEFKHSPLSVWIPLQDIGPDNGALGIIEKSHWFFSPYRGISFPFPFSKINDTVKKYLKPIYLKAGEAFIFDPRIVHNSFPNTSGSDRIVALCGIFPKEAEFITCYKEKVQGSKIELIKHDDSYILQNENFFYDCHARPSSGTWIETVSEDFPDMDSESFEKLCEINGIEKCSDDKGIGGTQCHFIAEPDGVNKPENTNAVKPPTESVWKKLKSAFT